MSNSPEGQPARSASVLGILPQGSAATRGTKGGYALSAPSYSPKQAGHDAKRAFQPERSIAFSAEAIAELGVLGAEVQDFSLRFCHAIDQVAYLGPLRERPERSYMRSGVEPGDLGKRGEQAVRTHRPRTADPAPMNDHVVDTTDTDWLEIEMELAAAQVTVIHVPPHESAGLRLRAVRWAGDMSQLALKRWEREFRRDAKADDLATFRDHLRRLDVQGEPEMMLEGTVQAVQAYSVYIHIDGGSLSSFLTMQSYHPAQSRPARYAFTFDLGGQAFARLLVATDVGCVDLADLYGHPWHEYRVCGFNSLWITRIDWTPLTGEELVLLEQQVTDDLRYDYSEDEVDFWFDDTNPEGALFVAVHDHEDAD